MTARPWAQDRRARWGYSPVVANLWAILMVLLLSPAQGGGGAAAPGSQAGLPNCLQGLPSDLALRCPRTIREYYSSRSWMPSESAIAELEAIQAELVQVGSAAAQKCEWRYDWYDKPPDILRLRSWMQLLDADSRRLERFSRRAEAAQRIAAMFQVARCLALIPRLDTQQESARLGQLAVARAGQYFINSRDAHDARVILDAADALAGSQESALGQCVATERVRWLTRPSDQVKLGCDGATLYKSASGESARIVEKASEYPLSRLAGEELQVELRAAEPFFSEVDAAWQRPDATALLQALSKRAQKGEFGAWVAAARPDFAGVRGELIRFKAALALVRDTARALAAGQPSP